MWQAIHFLIVLPAQQKLRIDKVYDFFFAEFISAFSYVQYSWIRNILDKD